MQRFARILGITKRIKRQWAWRLLLSIIVEQVTTTRWAHGLEALLLEFQLRLNYITEMVFFVCIAGHWKHHTANNIPHYGSPHDVTTPPCLIMVRWIIFKNMPRFAMTLGVNQSVRRQFTLVSLACFTKTTVLRETSWINENLAYSRTCYVLLGYWARTKWSNNNPFLSLLFFLFTLTKNSNTSILMRETSECTEPTLEFPFEPLSALNQPFWTSPVSIESLELP